MIKRHMTQSLSLVALVMIVLISLAVLAGCGSKEPSDPRDALISRSIKKAMSAKTPQEQLALFEGHPELGKERSAAEQMLMGAFVLSELNPYNLDLSRVRVTEIKLKPARVAPKGQYCLEGAFNYKGPANNGKGLPDVNADGPGNIRACTGEDKDGKLFLARLSFELDSKTWQDASR